MTTNSPRSLYSSGTRLIGLHGPAVNSTMDYPDADLLLELRRDCPSDGEFVVVDYVSDQTEQHWLYTDEASAFLQYWKLERSIWAAKGETKNVESANRQIAEWERIQRERFTALNKENQK